MTIMNIKRVGKILICMSLALISFSSCTSCQGSFLIKNCTKDTLLIDLTESDTLDDWVYWDEHMEDTLRFDWPEDTTVIYVHGKKTVIRASHCVLPDSVLRVDDRIFFYRDTYYIQTIKWDTATHYTLEEIRARKLYDTQTVTKKDFRTRLFEYKPTGSKGDH